MLKEYIEHIGDKTYRWEAQTTKLTLDQKANIVTAYRDNLVPILELAKTYGRTRQLIYRILKKHGVDTSKSRRIEVKCHYCEKSFPKKPSQVRRRKYHYCTFGCYLDCIKAKGQDYIQNRHGQRRARSAVTKHFDLKEDMIVHHENKDTLDNRLTNLRVFKNHSEHMRYHRGGEATPVWDGREV